LFLDEGGVSFISFWAVSVTTTVDSFVDATEDDEDNASDTKLEHTEGVRDLEVCGGSGGGGGDDEEDEVEIELAQDDSDVDEMILLWSIS